MSITFTPKQKVIGWTTLNIIAAYIVPMASLIYHFELFGGVHVEPTTKGLVLFYLFGVVLIGGILWNIRQIIKMSNKKGWQFALAKSGTPLFFFAFSFMLGLAEGNIDKLQAWANLTGTSLIVASYFRYRAGVVLEGINQPTTTISA
jgi:hypothetical protein